MKFIGIEIDEKFMAELMETNHETLVYIIKKLNLGNRPVFSKCHINYNGVVKTVGEFSKAAGITNNLALYRMNHGKSIEEMFESGKTKTTHYEIKVIPEVESNIMFETFKAEFNKVKETLKSIRNANSIIAKSKTRLYGIWLGGIKGRCYNKNHSQYQNYGGRGIYMCDEWFNDFEKFKEWSLEHGYNDELEIDRIDNNGPYAPWNCRWTTHKVNTRNTRKTIRMTINGVTKALKDWQDETGIMNLRNRRKWGLTDDQILDPNIDEDFYKREWMRKKNVLGQYHVTYKGETMTLMQFAEDNNLHYQSLVNRIKMYKYTTGEELMDYVPRKKHHKNVKIEWNGEAHTLREWSEITGIGQITINRRIEQGFPLDMVFYKGNLRYDKQKEITKLIGKPDERKLNTSWNAREDN